MSTPDDRQRHPDGSDPVEDRLRRALAARAATIEPAGDGLTRIEERLVSRNPMTEAQRWILGGVAAVAGLLVVVVILLTGGSDDDGDVAAGSSSTTDTTEATTTSTTTSTSTTIPAIPVDPFAVTFPSPADSRRFEAPVPAARAYATDVLGFTELVLGDIGDASGDEAEVVVSDREGGQETVIALSRLGEGTWYVTGSTNADIVVDAPAPGASLGTPFQTEGRALAFEGTVDVLVLEQGDPLPLGTGFVTGSGTPPAGPFDGRIAYTVPDEPVPGILVYRTLSAEDGHVVQATSFPVRLTAEQASVPDSDCGDTAEDTDADPGQRVVRVFFHCGTDFEEVVALRRTVDPDDPAVLTNTMAVLLEGPTDAERDAGFTSVFPVDGARVLDVVIADGVATVDLSGEVRDGLANSSANILVLSREVFRTASQFSSVAAVEILYDGSCEDYAAWAQSDTCLISQVP